MTESETVASTTAVADVRWQASPCPALVLGADGTVRAVNDAAGTLFPAARTGATVSDGLPGWLTDGHAGVVGGRSDEARGWVADRSIVGRPVLTEDDSVTWWFDDDTDVRSAREGLRVEQDRAAFLSHASAALLGALNLTRCMEVAAELASDRLADGALVITPASRGRYETVVCRHGEAPQRTVLRIDPDEVPGLAEALRGFPPVPSRWIDPALAPDWLTPDGFGEVGSIVVTPLPGHGVPAGALVLLGRAASGPFTEDEESTAREFAARTGLAMSSARMFAQQASITETLMRDLLPPRLTHVGGVEYAGGYRASADHERVGGDFYDLHPADDDASGAETLAVLGDVCGKGLDAAVLTGRIRSVVQALRPLARDHKHMLGLLNDALLSSDHTRFVTLVLASVSRHGPDVRLRLTCAGHPPPLVVRTDGRVEEAATLGTVVGALPTIETTTAEMTLAPGETCLLFTDGITEARGGPLGNDQFGEERLQAALAECAGMPAEAVVERVQMLAAQWVGQSDRDHDDMAVLAITAPRGQHLTAVGGHGRGRFTA
nr:SpoIIE family protein phosphatase [Pseudonocardia endophytica]